MSDTTLSPARSVDNDHHDHHNRHIGPVPVMVVTMVMVIAYCYGRGTPSPQAKGVLPGDIPIRGARAQRFATVWPGNKVCRVCGSHLAMWVSGPKAQSLRACAGWRQRRRCEPWCVPGLQVCTRPHENGQGRKINAGAGLRLIRRSKPLNRPQ